MTGQEAVENLFKTTDILEQAMEWLDRSYTICKKIGIKDGYSDEESDAFETLAGRYARASDINHSQSLPGHGHGGNGAGGTIIDVVNRARKRNLSGSVDEVREIEDIRNEIAHEYIETDLCRIFSDVLRLTPEVSELFQNIKDYCERYEEMKTEMSISEE